MPLYQTLQLSWGFATSLKPTDYLAVIAYDLKPEILCDFTNDKNKIQEGLHRMTIPAWREANMFAAVTDTADRMSGIEGRKAILLITSGIDTFSRLTYDQTRKSLQQSGVPVYAISLMGMQRAMSPRGDNITFLQADNELRTFAKETGGQTLPSPYYITDDVQYYPPGSEFKLAKEAAAMKAYSQDQAQQATKH